MTIEIDDRVAESLRMLQRQADERGMLLHEYLKILAAGESAKSTASVASLEEYDALVAELDKGPTAPGFLPADFSRADIYLDHD